MRHHRFSLSCDFEQVLSDVNGMRVQASFLCVVFRWEAPVRNTSLTFTVKSVLQSRGTLALCFP